MLLLGGYRRLWVAMGVKSNTANRPPSMHGSCFEPIPANAEVAVAAKPVRVDPATFARLHHFSALSRDVERRHRQNKPEPGQSTDRANLGFLNIPAAGLVVEKSLLDIEPQAELSKGLQVSGLVTDNGPKLAIDAVASSNDVDWPETSLLVQPDIVKADRLSPLTVKVFELAPAMPIPLNPAILFQASAIVPAPLQRQGSHQVSVDKATVG